jgi:hypothetical protein
MPLNLAQVHQLEKVPGTETFRLVKVHPTVGLGRQGEPPIWVQDGKVYYEGGEEVHNPPEWFWEEVRKMDPERRRYLGLRLPGEVALRPEPMEAKTQPIRRKRPRSFIRRKPASPPADLQEPSGQEG